MMLLNCRVGFTGGASGLVKAIARGFSAEVARALIADILAAQASHLVAAVGAVCVSTLVRLDYAFPAQKVMAPCQ